MRQLRKIQRYRYTRRAMRKEIVFLRAQNSEFRIAFIYWRERCLSASSTAQPGNTGQAGAGS